MALDMLRGIPGILKVVTLILGLTCVIFLAFTCSRPFEPVESLQDSMNPNWDKIYEGELSHVVEDEVCLSFVVIIFVVSIAWFVLLIIDKPLKDTKLRTMIDMGYHMGGGVLLIIMGILWSITASERIYSFETYNASASGDKDAYKDVNASLNKFGYFNLVIHGIKLEDSLRKPEPHRLSLYPHRYDDIVLLVLTGVFILLNGAVYVVVFVFIFLKKGVRVIDRDVKIPAKIAPMMKQFKELTGILKLLTIVLGIFAVALSGHSYAKSFQHQIEPMNKFKFETVHSYGEEIAFSIVALFLGLSIIWLVLYFLDLFKDSVLRTKMDILYHLVGGILILLAALTWVTFISLRIFDYEDYKKADSMTLTEAKNRVYYMNVIIINAPGRAMKRPLEYYHSNDEMKLLEVVLAGIFMFFDGGVYLGSAIYLFIRFRKRFQVQPEPNSDAKNNVQPNVEPAPEPEPQPPPPPPAATAAATTAK